MFKFWSKSRILCQTQKENYRKRAETKEEHITKQKRQQHTLAPNAERQK